jgi:hypothetical protein
MSPALPRVAAATAFRPHWYRLQRGHSVAQQQELIAGLPVVEVDP